MNEIRIGLVGLGIRGLGWLRLLQRTPGFRITALCDRIPALHEKGLSELTDRRDVKAYSDYDEFLADKNIDAVALVVRCREQGAMAARALEAGKHVNAEVPAAHTIEDCWRIVVAAERSGKVYQLAEQGRYAGFIQAWKDLVAGGRLGKVTYAEGQYIGYYGTYHLFQNPRTGELRRVEELVSDPEAKPTWFQMMPAIHYLPHTLSPMLKILDDRVVEVTAMSTGPQNYLHPEVQQANMQVALMKTEKDTILRVATSFTHLEPPQFDHHWYQFMGTHGRIEWRRRPSDKPKLWLADGQMHDLSDVDWRRERTDAPAEAKGSGHWDQDYYVHAYFRAAVLENKPLDIDVYQAMDTAAPAILAAESIAQGSKPMRVPNFRPNSSRPNGQMPIQ